MNLVIDMGELMPFFFDGAKFATLQRIDLEAACRLRRFCVYIYFPPNLCRQKGVTEKSRRIALEALPLMCVYVCVCVCVRCVCVCMYVYVC